ncbi:MAG: TIGR01777 family oxidoreductase [Cyclobacteriaceae bacterium]
MATNILITGGTGLIGRHLTEQFERKGYSVTHLSRSRRGENKEKTYIWDIHKSFIEDGALENANIVIHLAGAGVTDARWTSSRKKEILDSRVQSTRLLHQKLKDQSTPLEAFICASAIGIYGSDLSDDWKEEGTSFGNDFLAQVTEAWEAEAKELTQLENRVVLLRIGVVLSGEGGALGKLAKPIKLGIGAVLGSGKQYMSWIHIEDLCGIFEQAVTDKTMEGPYNTVAPQPVTNKEMTQAMAKLLNRSLVLPAVPGFALKLALGEMAEIVLNGGRVSSKKIEKAGYEFKFPQLTMALEDLLHR